MSVRDLFFDEFYRELEQVASQIRDRHEESTDVPLLAGEARDVWNTYTYDQNDRDETLISVDGGVQLSDFAYGDFVTAGRAIALIHCPGRDRDFEKAVKIYVGQVFDDRDKGNIPGYVRTICEYDAAYRASKRILENGGTPIVLMDGGLYLSRFPYAIREYRHHPELLADFFDSISRLRMLARDYGFPVVGVTKDSSVFYLYMELLKMSVRKAGLGRLVGLLEEASSPLDLASKMNGWGEEDKMDLAPFVEARPLCDPILIEKSTATEGYTTPLYLAPSIYYSPHENVLSLNNRIDKNLGGEVRTRLKNSVKSFFNSPGIDVTYWKPTTSGRPFRVDILASWLGNPEAWERHTRNVFHSGGDKQNLEKVLNHLGHWYCNEVEYNIPLRQADTLARFDRDLYKRKYEPFIIRMLEDAGLEVTGKRRTLREF